MGWEWAGNGLGMGWEWAGNGLGTQERPATGGNSCEYTMNAGMG